MSFRALLMGVFVLMPMCIHAQDVWIARHWSTQMLPPQLGIEQQMIAVEFEGRQINLMLEPNVELASRLGSAEREQLQSLDVMLYTGYVEGDTNSWVRLSWLQGAWEGVFQFRDEIYLLDRLIRVQDMLQSSGGDDQSQVVYAIKDLVFRQPIDVEQTVGAGSNVDMRGSITGIGILQELLSLVDDEALYLPVTIVADEEFIATHGDYSTAIIMGRINMVDGLYRNQVGVGIQLQSIELLSQNENLISTDASALLNAFRIFMTTGEGNNIIHDGIAHLFTGKNLDGYIVGMAWEGVLCNDDFGFAINQDLSSGTTSMLVFAHELGHNFGAPHDQQPGSVCEDALISGIMSPFINGSTVFSSCSIEQMADDILNCSCLMPMPDMVFESGYE